MECKAAEPVEKGAAAGSINRNIVECKDVSGASLLYSVRVLIETLWNVKEVHTQGANGTLLY